MSVCEYVPVSAGAHKVIGIGSPGTELHGSELPDMGAGNLTARTASTLNH